MRPPEVHRDPPRRGRDHRVWLLGNTCADGPVEEGVGTEIARYAAFAESPDGGNPAGVVLDAAGLSDDRMQQIAADVGYSETAFVFPGAHDVADRDRAERRYRVRYWSPAAEVPFCGHATVATAVALAERDGVGPMVFDTPAGAIPITTIRASSGAIDVAMTSVEPSVRTIAPDVLTQLLDFLGLEAADIDERFPPREAYAGNWHPILVLQDAGVFHQFRFAPSAIAALMQAQGWTGTVTVLHEAGADDFLARNLFPVGRLTEDPATGSAAASTGAYLRALGYASGGSRITIHQGAHVGRPSLLTVYVPTRGGITVTGSASPIGAEPSNGQNDTTRYSGTITGVLARVYVNDLDAALPLYERLTGDHAPHRFTYGTMRLATVGTFLIIQGAPAEVRTHAATVTVRDIGAVVDAIAGAGGTLLEGPAPGPNGARLIARHPDGNVVEYIENTEG